MMAFSCPGMLASSPQTGAGSAGTSAGPPGPARVRSRRTARRRSSAGAAPERPHTAAAGPADAPPGADWTRPPASSGSARTRAGRGGPARVHRRGNGPPCGSGSGRAPGSHGPAAGPGARCRYGRLRRPVGRAGRRSRSTRQTAIAAASQNSWCDRSRGARCRAPPLGSAPVAAPAAGAAGLTVAGGRPAVDARAGSRPACPPRRSARRLIGCAPLARPQARAGRAGAAAGAQAGHSVRVVPLPVGGRRDHLPADPLRWAIGGRRCRAGQPADVEDCLEPDRFDLTGAKHIQCTRGGAMPRRTAARRSAPATSATSAPIRSVA